jgi:VWFA-related protein
MTMKRTLAVAGLIVAAVVLAGAQQPPLNPNPFRFKSGVELINVTATVSDASGRFVPGLTKDDFVVYEDDQPQEITHFSSERVPVSLGIAIDTSGSMVGEKIHEAQTALGRFVYELLDKRDEIFIYRFSNAPQLLQGWTTDRQLLSRALERTSPNGGTAMYDTVLEALPLFGSSQNRKKSLVIISDGRDTSSSATISEVHQAIRASEVLVYAVGIDCARTTRMSPKSPWSMQRGPIPFPFPLPPGRRPFPPGRPPVTPPPPGPQPTWEGCSDPVDVVSLRDLTDDSGGRTEVVRDARDLNPATANIADELSKQYYLGYAASGKKDGRWHSIRVEVKGRPYRVRARRGYMAT